MDTSAKQLLKWKWAVLGSLASISGTLLCSSEANAAAAAAHAAATPMNADFDTAFLSGTQDIDFSRFTKGGVVLPGRYRVDLSLNSDWLGR